MPTVFSMSCVGFLTSSLVLSGCGNSEPGSKPDSYASLGDRLTLEVHYLKEYKDLPITAAAAVKANWTVSDKCEPGLGRRATTNSFESNAGNSSAKTDGAIHLWFDKSGAVMGFGARAKDGVAAPWHRVDDGFEIDCLLRDPEAACGNGPVAVKNSVGDRFIVVQNPMDASMNIEIPLTLKEAMHANYNDGGPCFPDMGWHMMYNRSEVSTPVPVYEGPAKGGKLLAMNLNAYTEQLTPSYEAEAPKEGSEVYGWHVYFREHTGICDGSPTAVAAGPAHHTPPEKRTPSLKCTPYFGNMFAMVLTSVVDVRASGEACDAAKKTGNCTFVNFLGPTDSDVMATPCEPPSPTDGCHCYHQVTYNKTCSDFILQSDLSARVDTEGAFNSNGVLKGCVDKVTSHTVVGWAPPAETPTPCDCEQPKALLV